MPLHIAVGAPEAQRVHEDVLGDSEEEPLEDRGRFRAAAELGELPAEGEELPARRVQPLEVLLPAARGAHIREEFRCVSMPVLAHKLLRR